MQFLLVPHPATPPAQPISRVWANVELSAGFGAAATVNIWFGVGAPAERFVLPPPAEPHRADGLWQSTCFEAFLRADGEAGYREWNFAPSGGWAAYDFTAYRAGMCMAEVAEPYLRVEDNLTWLALGATIAVAADQAYSLALSAVLEERDGTKSYWALAHPSDGPPDFHHDACFAGRLAPIGGA